MRQEEARCICIWCHVNHYILMNRHEARRDVMKEICQEVGSHVKHHPETAISSKGSIYMNFLHLFLCSKGDVYCQSHSTLSTAIEWAIRRGGFRITAGPELVQCKMILYENTRADLTIFKLNCTNTEVLCTRRPYPGCSTPSPGPGFAAGYRVGRSHRQTIYVVREVARDRRCYIASFSHDLSRLVIVPYISSLIPFFLFTPPYVCICFRFALFAMDARSDLVYQLNSGYVLLCLSFNSLRYSNTLIPLYYCRPAY
jgi:hypothetical protein